MAVGDTCVSWLSHTSTNTKPPTTFLTCFSRSEKRKYAGKKVRLNCVLNSQPPGHEPDTLNTGPPGQGTQREKAGNPGKKRKSWLPPFSSFQTMFLP